MNEWHDLVLVLGDTNDEGCCQSTIIHLGVGGHRRAVGHGQAVYDPSIHDYGGLLSPFVLGTRFDTTRRLLRA